MQPCEPYSNATAPTARARIVGRHQGEANNFEPDIYSCLFKSLIRSWRQLFHDDALPFVFVQLQPCSISLQHRLAQADALALPRVGMATAIDLGDRGIGNGDYGECHSRYKDTVAARAALELRRLIYGDDVCSAGPVLSNVSVVRRSSPDHHSPTGESTSVSAVLSFTNAAGIHFGPTVDSAIGCALPASQEVFMMQSRPVDAEPSATPRPWLDIGLSARNGTLSPQFSVDGDVATLTLGLPGVPSFPSKGGVATQGGPRFEAVALRYAWQDFPDCVLRNGEGFPAVPFQVSLLPPPRPSSAPHDAPRMKTDDMPNPGSSQKERNVNTTGGSNRPPPPPFKPEMPCGSQPCGPSNQVCASSGSVHYAPPKTRYTFHLTDASCGIGDPNGPFFDPLHQIYHLFHQDSLALPHASRGGVIGHWASRDFLHWTQLPVALWNDKWYDYVAVWSGSVTVVNGTPHFIYPGKCAGDGVENPSCRGFTYNLAVPQDHENDPLLKNWSKDAKNPLLNGTGDDPSEAWRTASGEWRLIGNQACTQGSSKGAPIYASVDFKRWSKVGCTTLKLGDCPTLFKRPPLVPGEQVPSNAALPSHVHKAGSGNDQLQAGIWTDGKPGAAGTWEQIGGSVNLDNGATHASKNFFDPVFNRSIMWVWGTVHGGIQTVPREMHWHPQLGRVVFTPAREMIRLRKTPTLARLTAAELDTTPPLRLNASSSSEISIHFGLPSKGDMQISISLLGGAGTVFVNLTRSAGGNGSAVCGFRSPYVCGGHDCPLPCVGMTPCYTDSFALLPTDLDLEVRMFLDGNTGAGGAQYAVAEAYFQGGRVAMTMPLNASCAVAADVPCAWDASISARGENAMVLNATSHQLGSIWVSEEQVLRRARPARVKTDDATASSLLLATSLVALPALPARLKTDDFPRAADAQEVGTVDWESFLARSDPVNEFRIAEPATLPDLWLESSFAGNGMLGTQAMVCPGGVCRQSLLTGSDGTLPAPAPLQVVLPLARGDVSDIRSGNDSVVCTEWHGVTTCTGDMRNSQPKLGIGALVLSPTRGEIVSGVIRTHLHNASISVSVNA